MLIKLDVREAIELFKYYLGGDSYFHVNMSLNKQLYPVFIHIDFESHEVAWRAYYALRQAAKNGAPIKPTWIKSNWYYTIVDRHKTWKVSSPSILNSSFEDSMEESKGAAQQTTGAAAAATAATQEVASSAVL